MLMSYLNPLSTNSVSPRHEVEQQVRGGQPAATAQQKNADHEKRQSTCAVADFAAWLMILLNKKVDAFVARVIKRPVISSNPSAAECAQWTCFLCLSGQLAQGLGQGLGPF